jgi:hypothetical protein
VSTDSRAIVLNPEAIGDPNQTPILHVETDDNCPMHSRHWLYAAVRNNRRLSDLPPQDCACDATTDPTTATEQGASE